MWRTVSARLRGAKQELIDMGEDTDGLVESTSKLRDQVKALTGFDIMEDENTYKDIMEIVIGIGEAWEDLTDIERAGLLESLAGKQQSNALAAALQNVDIIKEAYETAQNADGSAQQELNAYLEGIQGHLDRLSNSVQEFWHSFIDTDVVKVALNFLTSLINLATKTVDSFGAIRTSIAAIVAALSVKTLVQKGGGRAKCICCIRKVNYPSKFNFY